MKILIADPQPKVRHALFVWISGQPGCEIVGQAGDAGELMALLERLSPEVVILDRDLPGLPPAELVACMRQAQNQLVIIMLISAPLERCFSVKLDVDYVISKVDPPGRMLDVIRSAGNPRPKKPPA